MSEYDWRVKRYRKPIHIFLLQLTRATLGRQAAADIHRVQVNRIQWKFAAVRSLHFPFPFISHQSPYSIHFICLPHGNAIRVSVSDALSDALSSWLPTSDRFGLFSPLTVDPVHSVEGKEFHLPNHPLHCTLSIHGDPFRGKIRGRQIQHIYQKESENHSSSSIRFHFVSQRML